MIDHRWYDQGYITEGRDQLQLSAPIAVYDNLEVACAENYCRAYIAVVPMEEKS